jgi:hypothetical protein
MFTGQRRVYFWYSLTCTTHRSQNYTALYCSGQSGPNHTCKSFVRIFGFHIGLAKRMGAVFDDTPYRLVTSISEYHYYITFMVTSFGFRIEEF